MKNDITSDISAPAIERLCRIHTLITGLHKNGQKTISSSQIVSLQYLL